ncbi:hypothetical protein CDAR_589191 [Caerostris darwini]|uniref:Secreted protein n=1 Tax=Caerostris darwini TaxID=1538125 RepID=A0AAV4TDV5_9ARAC|nr:hypothetical protein CDAR_589191 [Caerostris darwini]
MFPCLFCAWVFVALALFPGETGVSPPSLCSNELVANCRVCILVCIAKVYCCISNTMSVQSSRYRNWLDGDTLAPKGRKQHLSPRFAYCTKSFAFSSFDVTVHFSATCPVLSPFPERAAPPSRIVPFPPSDISLPWKANRLRKRINCWEKRKR